MEPTEASMAGDLTEIRMTGLDDKACRAVERGSALMRMVITLSDSAPSEWAEYFEHAWQNHIYMMKRRAYVSGSTLQIDCVPDELEKDHIPELKKVIEQTNRAYAAYHAKREQKRAAEAARQAEEAEKLGNLKKSIKFD
jgi:hypothetical protein